MLNSDVHLGLLKFVSDGDRQECIPVSLLSLARGSPSYGPGPGTKPWPLGHRSVGMAGECVHLYVPPPLMLALLLCGAICLL